MMEIIIGIVVVGFIAFFIIAVIGFAIEGQSRQ